MSIRTILILLCFISGVLSCSNVFTGAATKDSDEALYEDALKLMDRQSWDSALAKMDEISNGFKQREDVLETWAGIYAGKCGLNFAEYFDALGNASLSGSTLMLYFMNAFTQRAVDPSSCYQAQLRIEQIGATSAERSAGQNLFMAILGMVKIGTYLRNDADTDGANNLGDGSADAGHNSCMAGSISDGNLNQIISGMGLITDNLTALSAVIAGGDIDDALDDIQAVCGGGCGETDPDQVAAGARDIFRDILRTGPGHPNASFRFGIDNACNDDPPLTCCM